MRALDQARGLSPSHRDRLARLIRDLREAVALQGDVSDMWRDTYNAAADERDELRAILAPLLDNPIDIQEGRECLFCGKRNYRIEWDGHHDFCETLQKNRLLGRTP